MIQVEIFQKRIGIARGAGECCGRGAVLPADLLYLAHYIAHLLAETEQLAGRQAVLESLLDIIKKTDQAFDAYRLTDLRHLLLVLWLWPWRPARYPSCISRYRCRRSA